MRPLGRKLKAMRAYAHLTLPTDPHRRREKVYIFFKI